MSAILMDNFFHIDSLEKEEGKVSARVSFEVGHPIFKGHFPDMPVVPGVCQTQMLAEVFSLAIGSELLLSSAASIKFLSLVDPNKNRQLDLSITYTKTDQGTYNVSAQYMWNETVFFKFKGIYTDK